MVRALQRAEQIAELGVGQVDVADVPANRLQLLARTGLGSKATALARLGEPKRTATLMAVVRHLEATAVDDTLDLFALLMATRLFSPARRASAEQRLAGLPRLEKASGMIARAGRVLLQELAAAEAANEPVDVAALWSAIEAVAPRTVVAEAIGIVEEMVAQGEGSGESALRAALAGRYNTVRPFLNLLGGSAALRAAPGGERVLSAVRALPELARRRVTQKPLVEHDIDADLVSPAWQRAVHRSPGLAEGAVDRDAYVVCVLEQLQRALGRRDVFAHPSRRWDDPRALLLEGERWEAVSADGRIHVVHGGHRGDDVERLRRERVGQEVAVPVVDAVSRRLVFGQVEGSAGRVRCPRAARRCGAAVRASLRRSRRGAPRRTRRAPSRISRW